MRQIALRRHGLSCVCAGCLDLGLSWTSAWPVLGQYRTRVLSLSDTTRLACCRRVRFIAELDAGIAPIRNQPFASRAACDFIEFCGTAGRPSRSQTEPRKTRGVQISRRTHLAQLDQHTAPAASPHVNALQSKHETLEARLRDEQGRPAPDAEMIQEIKKQKLKLKEEIERA